MTGIEQARAVVAAAVAAHVFPAAVVDVGYGGGSLWNEAFGRLTFEEQSPPTRRETVFDLASLTKPMATTTAILDLVAQRRVALDLEIRTLFDEWRGADRQGVTVADLLEHASGLRARLVEAPPTGRREFQHEICRMALEYAPRSRSAYSDLGFILLAFLAADAAGAPMDAQFSAIRDRLATVEPLLRAEPLGFSLDAHARVHAAPTVPLPEDRRKGRLLGGEVHDNYAAALGGVAGHAGLFGTAGAVAAFARCVLRAARGDASIPAPLTPPLVTRAIQRSAVPGSSRALGWDTMLPSSSCGTRMSSSAFGHVGFTGTSLWIDPARDRYYVLLTNRACGGRSVDDMREVRRAFHDALGEL